MTTRLAALLVAVLVAAAGPAEGVGPITFSEPEFPLNTPVDGFTVTTLNGTPIPPLSFAYTIGGSGDPSADVTTYGPPPSAWAEAPFIEGPSVGVLSMNFGADTVGVRFGFVVDATLGGPRPIGPAWSLSRGFRPLSTTDVLNALTVRAMDETGAVVATRSYDAVYLPGGGQFPGNTVNFLPGTTFRSVEFVWNPTEFSAFVVDNVLYGLAPVASEGIPTLSRTGLLALAVAVGLSGLFVLRGARA